MDEDSQIVVPPSFIALFVPPGRSRPAEPRQWIAQRYEFCEDLATLLSEQAAQRVWELGISEDEVLARTRRGLLAGGVAGNAAGNAVGGAAGGAAGPGFDLSEPEAGWVIRRVAELLGWPLPAPE